MRRSRSVAVALATLAAASLMALGMSAVAAAASEDPAASHEPAVSHEPSASAPSTESLTRSAFHDAMRKLWEDHITWTRLYIVSAATGDADLPDIGPTTDRLLQNQAEIADAIRPFFGDAAGDQLNALLDEHILTAAEVIAAARAGDADGQADALDRWYVNGDEIATFLSEANPEHWPLDMMKGHMRSHLDLTLAEAVARLEGRHADEVAAYDAVHAQILAMADMLSDGIIALFPDRFQD